MPGCRWVALLPSDLATWIAARAVLEGLAPEAIGELMLRDYAALVDAPPRVWAPTRSLLEEPAYRAALVDAVVRDTEARLASLAPLVAIETVLIPPVPREGSTAAAPRSLPGAVLWWLERTGEATEAELIDGITRHLGWTVKVSSLRARLGQLVASGRIRRLERMRYGRVDATGRTE